MHSFKNALSGLILLLFLPQSGLLAQDFIRLKGTVIDEKTGSPLPYVTVRIKGAPVGSITDRGGKFSFWISRGYSQRAVLFSSVGYFPREVLVTVLSKEGDHRIALKEDVRELAAVTVISERQLSALEVLKRAVKRIPENYISEQHSFDAYYRELVTENGAVIKYADGAITIDQSAYDGKKYRRENYGGQQLERQGTWLGGYSGIYRIGDRLHDHFGHKTANSDRVLIHEARASLNHSREQLMPNIEAGPLATLSKDLVKYLRHFIAPGNYGAYIYELAEIPDGKGEWDYLVRFKPKKPAQELTGDENIVGGSIRKHVLVGEIYIDPETYVIKKLNYRVGPEYRSHICSLGFMQIIHYGYEVSASYRKYSDKWQLQNLKRVDEFLFPDTVTNKTTPFSAISQIWVTKGKSGLSTVPDSLSFDNKNHNYFQSYHLPYHPEFWQKYEEEFPQAIISDSLKRHMEERMSLEAQFALRSERDSNLSPPTAPVKGSQVEFLGNNLTDDYQWLENEEAKVSDKNIQAYKSQEYAYSANYMRPLGKMEDDLWLELQEVGGRYLAEGTIEMLRFGRWSQFKSRSAGKRIYKQSKQYKVKKVWAGDENASGVMITLLYMGEGKEKSLSKRPLLVKVTGTAKSGLRMPFDPSVMPLLKRGIIIAYVHLKGAEEAGVSWYMNRKLSEKSRDTDNLIKAITYLKNDKTGNADATFLEAKGAGAVIVAAAINRRPDLCQGIFFHSLEADPIAMLRSSDREKGLGQLDKWGDHRKEEFIRGLISHGPYQNLKAQYHPNMAFFNAEATTGQYQYLKMLARLRSLKTNESHLLLLDRKDPVRTIALEYTLLFQWLEDLRP